MLAEPAHLKAINLSSSATSWVITILSFLRYLVAFAIVVYFRARVAPLVLLGCLALIAVELPEFVILFALLGGMKE
jgi:hypothetical protein